MAFETKSNELRIVFDNPEAASHFKHWLCGQGEQDYWAWMRYREYEEEGPITATRFEYHKPGGDVVKAICGRLSE